MVLGQKLGGKGGKCNRNGKCKPAGDCKKGCEPASQSAASADKSEASVSTAAADNSSGSAEVMDSKPADSTLTDDTKQRAAPTAAAAAVDAAGEETAMDSGEDDASWIKIEQKVRISS